MKSKRRRDGTPAANRVDRDAPMFQRIQEELRAEYSKSKAAAAIGEAEAKQVNEREPIGYCAYCGRALYYERSWHWMYDEDGQRVRKCKSLRACASKRKKNGQEESYRRAMALFNRPGGERWLDFDKEDRDDQDE